MNNSARRILLGVVLLTGSSFTVLQTPATAATVIHRQCGGGNSGGIYNYVNPGGLREAWTYNFSDCQQVAVLACCYGNGIPANDPSIAYQASYSYSPYSSHVFSDYGQIDQFDFSF